jgi:hypothetical protein
MSENVPFFDHIHSKFAGSANMAPKLVQYYISIWGVKNAKLYADTKIFAMGFLKSYGRKL